jgi:hypothetical protein
LGSGIFLDWWNVGDGSPGSQDGYTASDPDIPAGETHTLRLEVVGDDGVFDEHALNVDVVAPYDSRFESGLTFDDSVHQNGGYLDGPELYPDLATVNLSQTETRRDVTEATAEITTNSTDANQFIELRIGSDSFDRTNNSATASTTATSAARTIDVNLGLSRYPDDTNPQNATPRFGYNGQSVDTYELRANPTAISPYERGVVEVDAVVPQGEIVGDRLEEAGQLASDNALLTRSIFAAFDVFAEQEIRSSEKTAFDVTRD